MIEGITVVEAIRLKKELQNTIGAAIRDFQQATGTSVITLGLNSRAEPTVIVMVELDPYAFKEEDQ